MIHFIGDYHSNDMFFCITDNHQQYVYQNDQPKIYHPSEGQ